MHGYRQPEHRIRQLRGPSRRRRGANHSSAAEKHANKAGVVPQQGRLRLRASTVNVAVRYGCYRRADRLRTLNVHPKETRNDNHHDDDADDVEYTHCVPFLMRIWTYILPSSSISVVTTAAK